MCYKSDYDIIINLAVIRDAAKGAATSINCAINPELNSQQFVYYEDTKAKSPSPSSM